MDIATLIGLLIGLGGLIGGFLWEGGTVGMLIVKTAAVIVFGGTFGAVILSFTMEEIKTVPYFLKVVFLDKKIDYLTVLDSLVETADKARREGLLSLESQLSEINNPFLARGLQLVIDGTDPELTRNMLEMEIEAFENKEKVGQDIFMSAGGFAPTMGIIGTVMGLVHVLSNVSDPDKLGGAIAVAFLATLYGVGSANVLWIPFGTKIKGKSAKEVLLMELVLEGILSIQAGENPRVIREKLMTFLPPQTREAAVEQQQAQARM
ncbi:MAG: flagellar motor protein [Syntrophomonadaceae bacterium]|nr:flagellar motor protein [Syntrophomonadaceae bacterium]MDD3271902.1 flagellar motor protein [Syntrophomonadaceae bacterium]MDD3898731.1 flagellar motor protein [Syntrophomonadaceae bacterium]MDD4562773.1 flagellar motor protein [Syntrophomonadaceae bacterium]